MDDTTCSTNLVTEEISKLREFLIPEYFYLFLCSKGLKPSENKRYFYDLRSGKQFLAFRCWDASDTLLYRRANIGIL